MDSVIAFLAAWKRLTNAFEATLIDNLAATSPWLAPVLPAFLAYRSMDDTLAFPAWVAMIGALTVEFLGLSTVHTAFSLWDYNDSKRKSDQGAPIWAAILTASAYIVIVLTVNVLLDKRPIEQMIALALLSLLSVIAAVTLAIRSNHARRLAEIASEKAERKAARAESFRQVSAEENRPAEDVQKVAKRWSDLTVEERDQIRTMSTAAIVQRWNTIPRTARNWRKAAEHNGYHEVAR